ncbi:MAG TPA: PIN domain-containing protein [Anaerolineae bacterium]|nr:PIN domain-containing protein [Anaerolineae bacterium]
MTRVLLDTNVILDFLLDREPFAEAATQLWQANEQGRFEGYISAITPINVFYIARKLKGPETARRIMAGLLAACRICRLDVSVLQLALTLQIDDYEDAVQCVSATTNQLDAIVTRDVKDYAGVALPVYSPVDFLKQLIPHTEQ